jgi:hypothetical protein
LWRTTSASATSVSSRSIGVVTGSSTPLLERPGSRAFHSLPRDWCIRVRHDRTCLSLTREWCARPARAVATALAVAFTLRIPCRFCSCSAVGNRLIGTTIELRPVSSSSSPLLYNCLFHLSAT